MKNNRKHIDDLFRDGLDGLELTDTGNVWERVEATMQKKKKRRGIFWLWFLTGILLVSSITLSLFQWTENMTTGDMDKANVLTQRKELQQSTDQQIEAGGDEHAFKSTPSFDNENSILANSGVKTTQIHPEEQEFEWDEPQEIPEYMLSSEPSISSTLRMKGLGKFEDKPDFTGNDLESANRPGQEGTNVEQPNKAPLTNPVDSTEESTTDKDLVQDPPKQRLRPVFGLGLTGGMGLPHQESENMEGFDDYSKVKSNNENPSLSFTYGMQFDLSWSLAGSRTRLSVGSGLVYKDIRFNTPTIQFVQRDSFPFLGPSGDTIAMLPKAPRDSVVRGQEQLKYRGYSIPVEFGFAIGISQRVELYGTTGINMNFIRAIDGKTIDARLELQDANTLDYRRFQVGLTSSIGLRYAVGSNVKVSLSAHYAQFAPSLYKSADSGNSRIGMYGITTGVYYEFRH